jgi:hypothetical protein
MYCNNCQSNSSGKFCPECGAKLKKTSPSKRQKSWKKEKSLEGLINNTEFREILTFYKTQSPKSMSAEEFLDGFDTILKSISGESFSFKKTTQFTSNIFSELGINAGKETTHCVSITYIEVVGKTLFSMAKNGYAVTTISHLNNGIFLSGKIASDLWTMGGDILIVIQATDNQTIIQIKAIIKGQLFDWGKSQKVIDNIAKDISSMVV